jgi:hemoglobin-like flavoprotein
MSPHHIALVQSTFAQLQPIAAHAAALFYDRLFLLDPSLRRLFRNDLRHQGEALMTMIGWAVTRLDRPAQLLPALRALGMRHRGYGVDEAHYATVGQALIETLELGLGAGFTADVRDAWLATYSMIAGTMREPAAVAA